MAITKMVAVTVSGKLEEFDSVVERYICNQSIHLENAVTVLGDTKILSSFEENTEYDGIVKTAEEILKTAGMPLKIRDKDISISAEQMKEELSAISANVKEENSRRKELSDRKRENEDFIKRLSYIKELDFDISKLFQMEFIKARYGHLPKGGYKMLNTYLNDMQAVFVEMYRMENSDVWGFYFAPKSMADTVDEVFDSLYFERVFLPGDISGTPKQIISELQRRNADIDRQIKELTEKTDRMLSESSDMLANIYSVARKRQQFSAVRSNAARSKDHFYIMGWMSEKDAKQMGERAKHDDSITMFYTEKAERLKNIITPPTKLKNNFIFRPFEFFVKMYGIPGYTEFDPTPLLAVTYILFFGMMFGDVGQSALFAIGGFLIYKFKKIDLANIIGVCGLSGIVFGFLYGSVFGKEDIIHGVLPPMDNITTLLISTVAMGAVVIVLGLLLNIRNCYDRNNKGEMIFGHNGVAGLVFYVSVILLVLSKLLKINIPAGILTTLIAVSLLVIFMAEPLKELMEGKKDWFPKDGMFFVQSFFELFEVLLSYFSNTISFLRIGAFAIVHVGMMMAVEMLAAGGGVKSVIVTILGNALVMVMEGLVVGIQVLRLEYYEMFSRYFTGNGKPFESLKIK
ncbi:MAG: V-type ATPase 116kDa subunit family protein [Clostridiales bacterium]|nr:V-type ATPase 116kDa subunit family protein [Clostridiales bacterium]